MPRLASSVARPTFRFPIVGAAGIGLILALTGCGDSSADEPGTSNSTSAEATEASTPSSDSPSELTATPEESESADETAAPEETETAEETSEPEESASPEESAEDESGDVSDSNGSGTRDDPFALGESISSDDWTVTVNDVTLDATAAVMAENPYNDEPAAENQYMLINVTVNYTGSDSEMVLMGTDFAFVTATGEVRESTDAFAVAPDELDISEELYEGGTAQGNIVLEVPTPPEGTVRVRVGMFGDDEAFFAVN